MIISGEALSGVWRVKYCCALENGTWRVESRDSYGKVVERETVSPSPWSTLDALLNEAFHGLRNRIPERAPRPPLEARIQVEPRATKSLRLGPRRTTETAITQET